MTKAPKTQADKKARRVKAEQEARRIKADRIKVSKAKVKPDDIKVVELPVPKRALTMAAAQLVGGSPSRAEPRYEFPRPMPGVVPADRQDVLMANDEGIATAFAFAQQTGTEGFWWPGFTFLSEQAQRPENRRISETIAKECTRKWIRFHTAGDGDKSERIKALTNEMQRLKIQDAFRQMMEQDGLFGRSHLYIDLGLPNKADQLTPLFLSPAVVAKGSLKRVRVIEPIWTYPGKYNSTEPWQPDFYRPSSWFVMGTEIHTSRLPMIVSREVPDVLKAAYMFGGLSMTQMVLPYVQNWLRTRQSVSDLLHSFSVSGLKTSMDSIIQSGEGADSLIARAEMFNRARDNRGLFLIDKDIEEFFNVTTPLSTLDKLQAQAQEQMASIAGIPLTILLGITPSGLNASSEGEIRTFYSWIEALQNDVIRDPLSRIIKVMQLSLFGLIDPDIDFSFVPLWTLDEAAIATVRKTNADTAAVYVGQGIISPDEERQRLATEDEGIYNNLDLSVEITPPAAEGGPEGGELDEDEDPDGGPPGGGPGGGFKTPKPSPETDGGGRKATPPPGNTRPPKQQPTVGAGEANDEWDEDDHKRDEGGKFTAGGGSSHPSPHPLSKIQVAMHKIATSGLHTHEGKVYEIGQHLSMSAPGGSTHKYGTKLLKSLGVAPAEEPAKSAKTIPKPHPLSKQQVAMHEMAGKAGQPGVLNNLKSMVHMATKDSPGGATAKYGKKLLDAMGEASNTETPAGWGSVETAAETPQIPKPHEGSPLQKTLYDLVQNPDTDDAAKIAHVHDALKTSMTSGFAKKYAEEVLSALGGEPEAPSAPAPKPTPAPAKVTKAKESPRIQRMLAAHADAAKLSSTGKSSGEMSPEAVSIAPTLSPEFWSSAPAKARSAAKEYTNSGYHTMNSALRNESTENPAIIDQINQIDELFEHESSALTKDVVVRRGESIPSEQIDQWEKVLSSGLPLRYTKTGFTSVSLASQAAFSGHSVQFEIVARKGTRALGVDTVSSHHENELLLRHGQAFEIFEIKRGADKTYIKMATLQ